MGVRRNDLLSFRHVNSLESRIENDRFEIVEWFEKTVDDFFRSRILVPFERVEKYPRTRLHLPPCSLFLLREEKSWRTRARRLAICQIPSFSLDICWWTRHVTHNRIPFLLLLLRPWQARGRGRRLRDGVLGFKMIGVKLG